VISKFEVTILLNYDFFSSIFKIKFQDIKQILNITVVFFYLRVRECLGFNPLFSLFPLEMAGLLIVWLFAIRLGLNKL